MITRNNPRVDSSKAMTLNELPQAEECYPETTEDLDSVSNPTQWHPYGVKSLLLYSCPGTRVGIRSATDLEAEFPTEDTVEPGKARSQETWVESPENVPASSTDVHNAVLAGMDMSLCLGPQENLKEREVE